MAGIMSSMHHTGMSLETSMTDIGGALSGLALARPSAAEAKLPRGARRSFLVAMPFASSVLVSSKARSYAVRWLFLNTSKMVRYAPCSSMGHKHSPCHVMDWDVGALRTRVPPPAGQPPKVATGAQYVAVRTCLGFYVQRIAHWILLA